MKWDCILLVLAACSSAQAPTAPHDATNDLAPAEVAAESGGQDTSTVADIAVDTGQDAPGPDVVPAGTTPATCLSATANEGQCKDCCDCLDLPCAEVVACRDACPKHDFAGNTVTLQVSAPTVLGTNGDYSVCTKQSPEQACKTCCECENRFVCGDKRHCRDACMGVKTP